METINNRTGRTLIAFLLVASLAVASAGVWAREGDSPEQLDRQIRRLIEQLGDEDFFVRQRAQAELAKFSFEAFDALSEAAHHENLEIATRAKYLLRLMRVEWTTKGDPPGVKKLLADYEVQSTTGKLARMRALVALPDQQGIPALCRLVRYERSAVLSKRAAMQLIGREFPNKQLAEKVSKALSGSRRSAASWLRTYLQSADRPRAMIDDWTKLVDAELALLRRSPNRTSPEIVAELIRLQIAWLKQTGRKAPALAAMRKLIEVEQGDPARLLVLLDWLIEEEAWSVTDELQARFPDQFASNPLLLYVLADARLAQGNKEFAEETAARALALKPGKDVRNLNAHRVVAAELRERRQFRWAEREYNHLLDAAEKDLAALAGRIECLIELKSWKTIKELAARFAEQFDGNAILLYVLARAQAETGDEPLCEETVAAARRLAPGKQPDDLLAHLAIAHNLQHRGWFDWAQWEYAHVVESGGGGEFAVTARSWLAEMLHDQGHDLRAAGELQKVVDQLGPQAPDSKQLAGSVLEIPRTLGQLRARMNFFYASHFQQRNDRAKQREYLDKALAADSTDVDVLIGCYRISEQDTPYRKRILKLIEASAARIRREIVREPDDPTPYNQFAWLIGNTQGDFEEALRYSKRSLQLRPQSGGYLDTLAHVYFGMGDYENAVRTQTKAAELEPHSGLIRRKLDFFKKELQQRQK